MTSKEIGAWGEDIAARYLQKHGYRIINRNFTIRGGELDIVAYKDGCTVFIEVKTRKSTAYGRPSEYVDFRKQEKIRRTAIYFLRRDDADMRFDVIEILYHLTGGVPILTDINHIENAF